MALRVISGYRTVAFEAALLLARVPPFFLVATVLKKIYERSRELRSSGEWNLAARDNLRTRERTLIRRRWLRHVDGLSGYGLRTRSAITPSFALWMDRAHGNLTFHLTQILTGHGCFGTFLFRIGKVTSSVCEHYASGEADSAEHTLRSCTAWDLERTELFNVFGVDLTGWDHGEDIPL